jgi:hypothetical protein
LNKYLVLKLSIFLISQFLYLNSITAQTNTFEGSIMYGEKKNLSASLDLYIDSSYNVRGRLKRMVGNKWFNNSIEGKFNHEDNSIFIKEAKTIANSCPIYINGYVRHLMENFYVIAGVFKSTNIHYCDSGHVNLVNRDFLFNYYNHTKSNAQPDDKAALNNLMSGLKTKIEAEKVFIPVTSSDKINLTIDKDTFLLKIYDNLKVDGDRVKITFNDKIVAQNLSITSKYNEYILVARKGKNLLNIEAISEGSIPMNTSKVELYNYRIHQFYENKLLKSQKSTYIINYE